MLCGDILESMRNVVQRDIPFDFTQSAVDTNHRFLKTITDVQRFIGKTILVGYPAFVDLFILARKNSHHAITLDLYRQV